MSAKRKQPSDGSENTKNSKIMKLSETIVEMNDIAAIEALNEDRNFNFKLTDKKAKSNLIKSAKRGHLEIEAKQLCKNIRFSAGAYLYVAKQMVRECEARHKANSPIIHKNMEIKVEDFLDGIDLEGKHFDTKIVFSVNTKKVVMHCYNSTQNIKVEGSAYLDFIKIFLEPLFLSNIEVMKQKIVDYDKNVVTTLIKNAGKPLKRKSVKSIRSIINQPFFQCTRCDDAFDSYMKLKKHKVSEHSCSINSSNSSIEPIQHSTRNNSLCEEILLCEDITIDNLGTTNTTKMILDEKPFDPPEDKQISVPIIICDICKYETKYERNMEEHTQTHKQKHECTQCDYETEIEGELSVHTENEHKKIQCKECKFETANIDDMQRHATSHVVYYKCDSCEYSGSSIQELDTHTNLLHSVEVKELLSCDKCDFETE